jgi:hypothetical protein
MSSYLIYGAQLFAAAFANYEVLGFLVLCGALKRFDLCDIQLSSPVIKWLESGVDDL